MTGPTGPLGGPGRPGRPDVGGGVGGAGGRPLGQMLPTFLQHVPITHLPGGGGGLPGDPVDPGDVVVLPDLTKLLGKRPVDFDRIPFIPDQPHLTVDPLAAQHLLPLNTTPNLQEGLEARVKDPLWFLAMQWMTGEFEAENGGSVGQIEVAYQTAPMARLTRGGAQTTIDPAAPLERAIESEGANGSSPAWDSARLEYAFSIGAGATELVADEYDGRSLDWYHFDLQTPPGATALGATTVARVLPRNLRFEGMPHPRWWRFERGGLNLARIASTEPNFLQLLLAEYVMADSNNWYLAPLEQLAGDLRRLTRVTVFDSFGVATEVPPTVDLSAGTGWELFTLSPRGGATVLGGSHLYVPNVAANLVQGEPVEDIEFVRDEDANVVWAVERIYTDTAGRRINRSDVERPGSMLSGLANPATLDEEHRAMSVYRLQTPVAHNWIPFLPRRAPAAAGGPNPQMFLRRGRTDETASSTNPQHRTRVVAESWRLAEEEIPRTGVRVQRIWRFGRGADGSEHFWIGRRKDIQSVERSAGLDFDYLIPPP